MRKAAVTYTVVLLSLIASLPAFANFDKGLEAFKKNDFKTAYKVWKKLAEKGDPQIQSTIAVMFHTGTGVKKSYKQAFYWYKKAALQGVVAAQANLGLMYAKGTGTKQDYIQSYAWYSVAASTLSIEKVGSALWGIDYLATQMTAEQLNKAKKLTKEYEKKYLAKSKK